MVENRHILDEFGERSAQEKKKKSEEIGVFLSGADHEAEENQIRKRRSPEWPCIPRPCGYGVWDYGTDIRLHSAEESHGYLSDQQLMIALQRAHKKGWTTLYTYGPDKKTLDQQVAMRLQNMVMQMGLSGQITCCMNQSQMLPLRRMKKKMQQEARAENPVPA